MTGVSPATSALSVAEREFTDNPGLAADRDFHLGMLALASNTRLVGIVSSLRSQTRLLGLPPLVAQKALGGSAREHRTLLGLVAKG